MGLLYSKPSINEILHSLSNKYMPSVEFLRNGNIIANEVFNVLRRRRNDVDGVIVAGSIGKKTAVNDSSDFDLFAAVLNELLLRCVVISLTLHLPPIIEVFLQSI